MRLAITGTTRGLGKQLFQYYQKDHKVITFNRGDNIERFIDNLSDIDILINNSYLNGYQNKLFDRTIDIVSRCVVVGSVAADSPDLSLPVYSINKKKLQDKIEHCNKNILYLKISGQAYKQPQTIIDIINLWITNPIIKSVEFYPKQ